MSWQAMDAIDQLPYDACKPLAFRVLTKLANVATQDGTRAWRLYGEMASELGVDVRSIYRAVAELDEACLIRKGDQRAVSHWQGNRRPTVWDIVMHHGAAVQLPLPEGSADALVRGDTVIHSPGPSTSGVTPDLASGVATEEQEELLTKTFVGNHRGPVTPEARSACSGSASGRHHFDEQTGWCTNACGLRAPEPIGALA